MRQEGAGHGLCGRARSQAILANVSTALRKLRVLRPVRGSVHTDSPAVVRLFDAPGFQQRLGETVQRATQDLLHDADVVLPVGSVLPPEPYHDDVAVAGRALEHRDDVARRVGSVHRRHEQNTR